MDDIPPAVRAAYEAELRRLESAVETAPDEDARNRIREAIVDLEAELVVESWPLEE